MNYSNVFLSRSKQYLKSSHQPTSLQCLTLRPLLRYCMVPHSAPMPWFSREARNQSQFQDNHPSKLESCDTSLSLRFILNMNPSLAFADTFTIVASHPFVLYVHIFSLVAVSIKCLLNSLIQLRK
jgi:hypothetical protein